MSKRQCRDQAVFPVRAGFGENFFFITRLLEDGFDNKDDKHVIEKTVKVLCSSIEEPSDGDPSTRLFRLSS